MTFTFFPEQVGKVETGEKTVTQGAPGRASTAPRGATLAIRPPPPTEGPTHAWRRPSRPCWSWPRAPWPGRARARASTWPGRDRRLLGGRLPGHRRGGAVGARPLRRRAVRRPAAAAGAAGGADAAGPGRPRRRR